MATNNKADKRATRAGRRALQEEAARAAAEKAAKERRQQTIIGGIVVAIIIAIIGCIIFAVWNTQRAKQQEATQSLDEAYSALQEVSPKPSKADDKGGILISKNGYNQPVEGAPTAEVYMDFICPGCGNLNRKLDPTLVKLVDAGQLNLELHFMAFMDSYSTDEYSSRAANTALYIAENDDDPDHLLQFIANMYDEDFQPGEGADYVATSDEQIREQALKAGVPQEIVDKSSVRTWDKWLSAITDYVPLRSELWNQTGRLKGSFSSPTVAINGTYWDINQLSSAGMDLPTGFLASIGLEADQVGTDTMPSIGADGKPISLT